jgi:hypothetical protein
MAQVRRPQHTKPVRQLLKAVQADADAMLKLGLATLNAGERAMFPLDMMALGAVKRSVSTSSAMLAMVKAWNMVCARTLLRTHIDTSVRFSAAWLVANPHDFASLVLKGERIDRLKDRDGKRLTDAHLVESRTPECPWLPAVYGSLSGYVHFSGSHIVDSVATLDDTTRTIQFEISPTDTKFPEFSWVEVLECFRETTELLAKYLHGYRITKNMSPEQLAGARGDG